MTTLHTGWVPSPIPWYLQQPGPVPSYWLPPLRNPPSTCRIFWKPSEFSSGPYFQNPKTGQNIAKLSNVRKLPNPILSDATLWNHAAMQPQNPTQIFHKYFQKLPIPGRNPTQTFQIYPNISQPSNTTNPFFYSCGIFRNPGQTFHILPHTSETFQYNPVTPQNPICTGIPAYPNPLQNLYGF